MKRLIIKLIILLGLLTLVLIPFISMVNFASADGIEYFIICKPEGEINVRERAMLKSDIVACLFFGDRVKSDGKEKNDFVHVVDLNAEYSSGWVYKGLLVKDQPFETNMKSQVCNTERVACRKYADGKIQRWLKEGSEVTVYAVSEEWCVTNYGYIKTDFLTVNARVR